MMTGSDRRPSLYHLVQPPPTTCPSHCYCSALPKTDLRTELGNRVCLEVVPLKAKLLMKATSSTMHKGELPKSPGEKATNDFREGRRLLLVIYASGKKHIT